MQYGTFESCTAGCRKSERATPSGRVRSYIGTLTDDVGRIRWESLVSYATPQKATAVATEHMHYVMLRALLWSEV